MNILKKISSLQATTKNKFIYLPKEWCEIMKIEKQDQVELVFDIRSKEITIKKVK